MPYERPVTKRYYDPYELVWYCTANRLGFTPIVRNPAIFAMTDGTGRLELSTRDALDADDNAGQQIFHEIVHWIVAGEDSFTLRDWGYPLSEEIHWTELVTLRVQAALADRHGMRDFLAPTGGMREYFDRLGSDPMAPLDDTELEQQIVQAALEALARADGPPWAPATHEALVATAAIRAALLPFLTHYQTDIPDDSLPSLWDRAKMPR